MRYTLVALVAATVLAVLVIALLSLVGLPVSGKVAALIIEIALLASLVPLYRSGRIRVSDLGLRSAPGARSVGLVALALIAYVVASALWASLVRPPHLYNAHSDLMRQSTIVVVLDGFVAAVGAPVAEEVFFRGFLYRSLRARHGVLSASLIAGALFGLWHFQYPLLVRPELAFFGIAAALLYECTGSLLPGIAMHSFIDASGFDIELTGNVRVVAAVFVVVAVVLLLWRPVRAVRRWAEALLARQRVLPPAKVGTMLPSDHSAGTRHQTPSEPNQQQENADNNGSEPLFGLVTAGEAADDGAN